MFDLGPGNPIISGIGDPLLASGNLGDNIPPYAQFSASEVAAIPYAYRVRRPRRR